MEAVEQIKTWSEAFLPENLFVVSVEWKQGGRKLTVYVDGDKGVTIEECRKLNRHLSEKLDETDLIPEKYTLEVSSPGVDRPLTLLRQYPQHTGRELKMKLKAGTELIGRLEAVEGKNLRLGLRDNKKGKKNTESPVVEISFDDILDSTVQINFN